jgi:hypothetical protein
MLHVSSFTLNTFSGTHNPILSPSLDSMSHNISIDFSCTPNKLMRKELCPLEVNLCQNFTFTVLVVTFSYELCFANNLARWIALFEFIYLIYLVYFVPVGFYFLKILFRP